MFVNKLNYEILYNLCFLFDYIGVVFFVVGLYFVLSVCDWIDIEFFWIINLFNVLINK